MITVFTPTYNRGYIIGKLYESLCHQTNPDFEWIIVDDGSTDNTRELIQGFMDEGKIKLRYFQQQNSGKHIAINKGVEMAQGELFFIVDSDDWLRRDALDTIFHYYCQIKDDERFAGVSGVRITPDGQRIGGELDFEVKDCSVLEFSYKYNYSGDMAEAYKTSILKQYPFPYIEGERFCGESYVWNQIGKKYILRYINKKIYYCKYLPGGLTDSIVKVRFYSPKYAMLLYSEQCHCPIPILYKIKSAINFWRFSFGIHGNYIKKIRQIGLIYFPWILLGMAMRIRDIKIINK